MSADDRAYFYDEMTEDSGQRRALYAPLFDTIGALHGHGLQARHNTAQQLFLRQGITYLLYHESDGIERTLPFDLIPRMIDGKAWRGIERGVAQRVLALNHFLADSYGPQHALRDGIVSREMVYSSSGFCLSMVGVTPPRGLHAVLSGIDIVRDEAGSYRVLEDNLRIPSGIAYIYKNRAMMKRVFPEAFASYEVEPLDGFLQAMGDALAYLSPREIEHPTVVLLTPGIHNSAYYDHSFLAQSLGIELVLGSDLVVRDRIVYMRTTQGLQQVDVIYRRIDDDYLDPLAFAAESLIGVPGLFDAFRAGNVAIVNPWGNGLADDKLMYHFVPDMIRYYLGEEPILDNVPTYLFLRKKERQYVFDHMQDMVIKPVAASGGYGLFFGFQASNAEISAMKRRILEDPRGYIAQPLVSLSRQPALVGDTLRSCPIDLRPFVICGESPVVLPGGLTRVALAQDSMVVNSSQGGGVKDTWIVRDWEGQQHAESIG